MASVSESVPEPRIYRASARMLRGFITAALIFALAGPFYLWTALLVCWAQPLPLPCEFTAGGVPFLIAVALTGYYLRGHVPILAFGFELQRIGAITQFSRSPHFFPLAALKQELDRRLYAWFHGLERLGTRTKMNFLSSLVLLCLLWGSVIGLLLAIQEEESVLYGLGQGAGGAGLLLLMSMGVFVYAARVRAYDSDVSSPPAMPTA